jgi:hypothetical protein
MSFDQWNQQADAVNLSQWLAQQQGAKKNVSTSKKGRGGTLTSLISEAGGTGGALGGAAIGTAILPGVGTVLGAGIGGFLGGFSGRVAENKVRDDRVGLGDALLEGGISGATAAGPLKLLKAGKALKGASKAAPALEDAVLEASGKVPLKTSTQGRLMTMSNKALSKQYDTVPARVAREVDVEKTLGTLSEYGLTKPQDVERTGRVITGSDGIINKAVLKAVDGSTKVPTGNVRTVFENAANDVGLVERDYASVSKTVEAKLKSLEATGGSPQKTLQVMKDLEKRIANLQGKGGSNNGLPTPERTDQAKVLRAVHDELQASLSNAAGADKNIASVLTPELREELVKLHPGNQQWQGFVDDKVMKTQSLKQLRSTMAPFVKSNKLIDEGSMNSVTFGGRGGGLFNGAQGSLPNTLAVMGANAVKNPALRMASKGAQALSGEVAPNSINTGAKGIIARQAAGNVVEAAFANASSLEDAVMQAGGQQQLTSPDTAPEQPQSPYGRENLLADIQRDPQNAQKYIAYYQDLDEIYNPVVKEAGPGYTKPTSQQYAQGMTGLQSVDQLEQFVGQDPNIVNRAATPGQGLPVVGGLISRSTGTGNYRGAGQNILNSIARINTGANMPESERKFYEQTYLPQPGDTPQTIQQKLSTLRQFFSPIVNYQGGGGDQLEDAVLQAQQGAYR